MYINKKRERKRERETEREREKERERETERERDIYMYGCESKIGYGSLRGDPYYGSRVLT